MKHELPDEWEWKKLGDIADVFNGKTPSKEEQRTSGHPILKIKDIDANGAFRGTFGSFVDNEFFEKNKFKCLKGGDTLILNAAHNSEYVGSKNCFISTFEGEVIPTGEWLISRSNSELLDNRFKHYLLTSQSFRVKIKSIVKGIHLYPKDVRNLRVPVPPLETQHKIVAILEKAEETKKLRAQADELTQQLLQSVFLEMFGDPVKNPKGWDKKPLSEVCQINPKKSEITVSDDLEVSFIPMECVTENGQIINSKIRLLSDVLKGFTYFREGDILFAKITPCMENGKGAIANNLKNGIGFGSTEFHVLRSQNVINEWVYHLLSFEFIRKIAYNNMTGSAGQKRVTKSFFDKLKVGVPPLEIQQQFADIVHKTEEITEKQKMSKHEINIIFNTLMQKAFNGELVS